MKIETALNAEGQIIVEDDGCYFRVQKDGITKNYRIEHLNLSVKIIDKDASFYNDDLLDHNPESMGIVITKTASA